MPGNPAKNKGLSALIRELRRRHVGRLVALYSGTSFGLAYAGDLMVEALELPPLVLRVVVVLVLLGFPVVLFVGWLYDRTPEGCRELSASLVVTHTGIVGDRNPLFGDYWRDPEFVAATAVRF